MIDIKLRLWLIYKHYTKPITRDSAPFYFKVYWVLKEKYEAFQKSRKPPVEIHLNDGAKDIKIEPIDFENKDEEAASEEELYYSHPFTFGYKPIDSVLDNKMREHKLVTDKREYGVRVGRR